MSVAIDLSKMMPLAGNKSAPRTFKGKSGTVKKFLRQYDLLCESYKVPAKERVTRIIDYCSDSVVKFIEVLPNFQKQDWTKLQKDLLRFYDADLQETRYMTGDLRDLIYRWEKKTIKNLSKWKDYQREFITISGWLLNNRRMTQDDVAEHFWQGINRKLRKVIENRLLARSSKPDITKPFPISDVTDAAEVYLEHHRFDYNLARSDRTRDRRKNKKRRSSDDDDSESESEDESDSDSDTSESDSSDSSDSDEEYEHRKSLKKKRKPCKKRGERSQDERHSSSQSKDKKKSKAKESKTVDPKQSKVEDLIKEMSRMSISDPQYSLLYYQAVSLDKFVEKIVAAPQLQRSTSYRPPANASPADNRPSIYQSQPYNSGNRPPGPHKCYGCGEDGHGLRFCKAMNSLVEKGIVVKDQIGRYSGKDGPHIFRDQETDETLVQAIRRMGL